MAKGLLNFVVVGAKNSGKTVFLSTLFGMGSCLATANKETTDYLKSNWDELNNGSLPKATSSRVVTLEFQYKTEKYSIGFAIDDYDGYFIETLSADDEVTQDDRNRLKRNIKESEGLLFFFPYEEDHDDESILRFRYEINTFIQLIKEIYPDQKALPIPAYIAVSKWDRSPHFGLSDQNQKAMEYLDSVEPYQAAMAMIKTFFVDLKVEPLSSFGKSQDGVHPIKGKIQPYNLTGPFDYFLDVCFQRFEQKADELQAANYLPALYEFLTAIYNDIRFYKDGKLVDLHSVVEAEYASDVIQQLKAANGVRQQNSILQKHSFLCHNLKNEQIRDEIDLIVTQTRHQSKQRKAIFAALIVLAVFISVYGVFAYREYQKEYSAFFAIQQLKPQNMPKEFSDRCIEYLGRYKGASFFLPFTNMAKHREYVQEAYASARTAYADSMAEDLNRIKAQDPNEVALDDISELRARSDLFPDLEISQKIKAIYDQLKAHIEQRTATKLLLDKANILLSHDPDLKDIEATLDRMNQLPDDKDVSRVKANLSERLLKLQQESEFTQLYNEIKEEKQVREIPKLIRMRWKSDFPEEFNQKLRTLIQEKIKDSDSEAINDLKMRFELATEIAEQERTLGQIDDYFVEIPQLKFHYARPQYLADRLQNARQCTADYRQLLNKGILVQNIVFGATQKKNRPIGFSCGVFMGKQIILEFGDKKFSYNDKPKPICTETGEGRQELQWQPWLTLMPGTYNIKVTEASLLRDDLIYETVSISQNDILHLYNNGKKEFLFDKNPDYYVLFRK